jgi:hypothetical protein
LKNLPCRHEQVHRMKSVSYTTDTDAGTNAEVLLPAYQQCKRCIRQQSPRQDDASCTVPLFL